MKGTQNFSTNLLWFLTLKKLNAIEGHKRSLLCLGIS